MKHFQCSLEKMSLMISGPASESTEDVVDYTADLFTLRTTCTLCSRLPRKMTSVGSTSNDTSRSTCRSTLPQRFACSYCGPLCNTASDLFLTHKGTVLCSICRFWGVSSTVGFSIIISFWFAGWQSFFSMQVAHEPSAYSNRAIPGFVSHFQSC